MFVAAAVGIVAGAVLGTIGANRLVDALDSDLIHLVRQIDTSTYVLAAVAVLIITAVVLGIGVATAPRDAAGRPKRPIDRFVRGAIPELDRGR